MNHTILRVDASMRRNGSYSRRLADKLIDKLRDGGPVSLISRDLTEGVGLVNEAWIEANSTDRADRTEEMKAVLAESDALVSELRNADTLVLSTPIYNFGVPAALKAWIDQVCRARETFRYTDDGPQGLLEGKRAIVIVTSGGTAMHSDIDFASDFLRHVLGFIGITDVSFIGADQLMSDTDAVLAQASAAIEEIAVKQAA